MKNCFFQLTNVEKGGETAFARSGVRNAPKKGSAIFWYNLLSSGGRDNDTFHGACPVIFGEKLGSNAALKNALIFKRTAFNSIIFLLLRSRHSMVLLQ